MEHAIGSVCRYGGRWYEAVVRTVEWIGEAHPDHYRIFLESITPAPPDPYPDSEVISISPLAGKAWDDLIAQGPGWAEEPGAALDWLKGLRISVRFAPTEPDVFPTLAAVKVARAPAPENPE